MLRAEAEEACEGRGYALRYATTLWAPLRCLGARRRSLLYL
jgi:hypothetical protein